MLLNMLNKIWKVFLSFILNVVALFAVFALTTNINFNLNGDKLIYIDVTTEYNEQGYNASIFQKDISNKVIINSNLDSIIVDVYKIEYKLSFLGKIYKLERIVNVVDDVIPLITLNGDEEVRLTVNQEYNDVGTTAFDNYDKDITNLIETESNLDIIREGSYKITFSVKDSSGNKNSATRKINVIKKQISIIQSTETYDISNSIIKYVKENNYDVSIGYYNLVSGKKILLS